MLAKKYETVSAFLETLTNENYHTERCVVEAIMTGQTDVMQHACAVWAAHQAYGYMPDGLDEMRAEVYKEIERSEETEKDWKRWTEEDLQCALEDMAKWAADNCSDVPMIFRNDTIQKNFYCMTKEYKDA